MGGIISVFGVKKSGIWSNNYLMVETDSECVWGHVINVYIAESHRRAALEAVTRQQHKIEIRNNIK